MEYYFAYARTALKYGLKALNKFNNSKILIPDFICEDILKPIYENNIEVVYYSLDDKLNPIWDELENKIFPEVKFILMVHYFGKNQNIDNFISFSKKHNLFLIEDNAHGYGGSFNNKSLGSIGDFSISSPRKTLNINSGGILKFNIDVKIQIDDIKKFKITNTNFFKKKLKNNPVLKTIYNKITKRPIYENIETFRGSNLEDFIIDELSFEYLNSINLNELTKMKQYEYKLWFNFCKKNNLIPLFDNLGSNLSPWCFPAYVKNHYEAKKWFDWGWKNNVQVFSWPTLPLEIINDNKLAYDRWKKLICFSIKKY